MTEVLHGSAFSMLPTIKPGSIRLCLTSPPYWKLRQYPCPPISFPSMRLSFMTGTPAVRIPRWTGQFGHEENPMHFVAHLVALFRLVREALTPDGVLWVNLGDSYTTNAGGQQGGKGARAGRAHTARIARKKAPGLPLKTLIGVPWRFAFAMQADGWRLRQEIIWSKPNPMPESVTDRCTKSHEHVFFFSKSRHYQWDQEAIAEKIDPASLARYERAVRNKEVYDPERHKSPSLTGGRSPMEVLTEGAKRIVEKGTRNPRSVWEIPTAKYGKDHHAVFPDDLIRIPILACSRQGDTVLDCCAGTGTTGYFANRYGRKSVLIEPADAYLPMIQERFENQPWLL